MRSAALLLTAMLLMSARAASAASGGGLGPLAPGSYINPTLAVNQADRDTTLFAAARDGNLDALTRLLRQPSADVNARDPDGRTALMLIHSDPNAQGFPQTSISMAKALLSHGATINARDNNGMTALMSAAQQHNDDLVHYLVQHGADAGARDKHGDTALMQVVGDVTSNLIRYLCPNKTIVNLRNVDGKTSLMVFSGTVSRGYNAGGVVYLLVSLGADVNAEDDQGDTALMDAATNPAVDEADDVVQTLLVAGARIDAKNKLGRTAFDLIPQGSDNVAELLMAAGIKVPNWDGIWEGTLGSRPVMLCMSMNRFHKNRTAAYYALEAKQQMFLAPASNHDAPNDDLVLQGDTGTWELPIRYGSEEIVGVFSSAGERRPIHLTRIHDLRNADYGNPCASGTFLNGLRD